MASNSSFDHSAATLDGIQRAGAAGLCLLILGLLAVPLSALSDAYPNVPVAVTFALTTLVTYSGFSFFNEARVGHGLENRLQKMIVLVCAGVATWINIEWSVLASLVNTVLLTAGTIELVMASE